MKKIFAEKNLVIVLFILVWVVFSFAQRDTQKLFDLHKTKSTVQVPVKEIIPAGISIPSVPPSPGSINR